MSAQGFEIQDAEQTSTWRAIVDAIRHDGEPDGVKLAIDWTDVGPSGDGTAMLLAFDDTLIELLWSGWRPHLSTPIADLYAIVDATYNSTSSLDDVANDLRRADTARTMLTQPSRARHELVEEMRKDLHGINGGCCSLFVLFDDPTKWLGAIPADVVVAARAWRTTPALAA